MRPLLLLALAVALAACSKPAPPPAPTTSSPDATATRDQPEELVLVSRGGGCTEKFCGDANACCNTCELAGWYPPGAATALVDVSVADGALPLPTDVRIDSCDQGDYHLAVRATRTGGAVVVHSWTKVPGPGPR